jgi:hypothetical protein
MLLKILGAVAVFTSLLGAAGPGDSDVFSIRSYLQPNANKKFPITGQLFANGEPKLLGMEPRKNGLCASPLLEYKARPTNDAIGLPLRRAPDSISVPPPVPVCKNWTASEERSGKHLFRR